MELDGAVIGREFERSPPVLITVVIEGIVVLACGSLRALVPFRKIARMKPVDDLASCRIQRGKPSFYRPITGQRPFIQRQSRRDDIEVALAKDRAAG